MWLLLVEDETRLAASLKRGLEEEGYTVEVAHDGAEGYLLGDTHAYDAMVVDWRLPRKDGRTLVRELREAGCRTPILMLTALSDIDHRVAGLDAGADDYLAKPFSFEELLARLRALTRRAARPAVPRLSLGPLELDTSRRRVTLLGADLWLRPKEYAILELFMRQPGRVLTRTVLAERVWGSASYVTDNVMDVTMSRLRQKLSDAMRQVPASDEHVRIETVRGVGYSLVAEPGAAR
jgi:DNA-binding response OmpR family regulator